MRRRARHVLGGVAVRHEGGNLGVAMHCISSTRKAVLVGGSTLLAMLAATSDALAQNCTNLDSPIGNLSTIVNSSVTAAASIASSVASVNTAFLTQQGSAFVANPGGAPPDTQGGGVWVRGVGGEVNINSTSTANTSLAVGAPLQNESVTGTINCNSREHSSFAGVQVGSDIAKLNWGGWNLNLGTTAGYLASDTRERLGGATKTHFEVPFLGTYLVATYGGFFADVMLREDFYNINLDSPGNAIFDQPFSARSTSVSASAGYNFALPNNWFIEPSAGFIWSRTKVDAFNTFGPPDGFVPGTVTTNDIDSKIGRATLRVGTTFTTDSMLLQPFVSASVFHEFAGNVTSTYQTCGGDCLAIVDTATGALLARASLTSQISTSRVGTYGQFSAGLAGQILNTGWVGFVRGDYRTGDNLEGWTANAGVRYNFLPAVAAAPLITKGPAVPVAVLAVVDWSGFYVGGFLGGDYGASKITTFDGFGFPVSNAKPRIAGLIGGGTAGYNWQLGRYVVGLEGDIGATNTRGARPCGATTGLPFVDTAFTSFFFTCQNELDWVATFAGRLGVTWDRTLIYGKAGVAWTREKFTANCIGGPFNVVSPTCFNANADLTSGFTASDDRVGGVFGFGTEFALTPNWSAKAEYSFIDFGRDSVRATDGTVVNLDTHITEVKVGVNYRFNSSAPLAARY